MPEQLEEGNEAEYFIGQTSENRYDGVDEKYADTISQTRICVTSNPGEWEGDSRTWESLAGGAMVMVDEMQTPLAFPIVHGEHVVHFIVHNTTFAREKFKRVAKMYMDDEQVARRIGFNGWKYAHQYHRSTNRLDYMVYSAMEVKNPGKTHFMWTGQQLLTNPLMVSIKTDTTKNGQQRYR